MSCDYLLLRPHANLNVGLLHLTAELRISRPTISTPSSGTRPLGRVVSRKAGQRGPHTIQWEVLIHSGSLRKAGLGTKRTMVAAATGEANGCPQIHLPYSPPSNRDRSPKPAPDAWIQTLGQYPRLLPLAQYPKLLMTASMRRILFQDPPQSHAQDLRLTTVTS